MSIEIEKKYRLSREQREAVLLRLPQIGSQFASEKFEENIIYEGHSLDTTRTVLRLRRVGNDAILTYKERFPGPSAIKHQREDETQVADPEAMEGILDALGFRPALVYEKRRQSWRLGEAEIVIDELPFGLYMEIEGAEREIETIEITLAIPELAAEESTYPELTRKHGTRRGEVIEARFEEGERG